MRIYIKWSFPTDIGVRSLIVNTADRVWLNIGHNIHGLVSSYLWFVLQAHLLSVCFIFLLHSRQNVLSGISSNISRVWKRKMFLWSKACNVMFMASVRQNQWARSFCPFAPTQISKRNSALRHMKTHFSVNKGHSCDQTHVNYYIPTPLTVYSRQPSFT